MRYLMATGDTVEPSRPRLRLGFAMTRIISLLLATLAPAQPSMLDAPFVVTQLPARTEIEKVAPTAGGMLRADYGEGASLIIVSPDLSTTVLSRGFHSACDPDVSFDGLRIVFAGKKKTGDDWHIFEIDADGSKLRKVTDGAGGFRSPGYQSSLYTLRPVGVPSVPEYHLTFVAETGAVNEFGDSPATGLWSCKLDGSGIRRLTFNLSSDIDPFIQTDGRLLFAGWRRSNLNHGPFGRIGLFGVNIDGTDYAAFMGPQGKRIKHMPCTTTSGLAVFIETEKTPWDGAGTLGSVKLRRPLNSYRTLSRKSDGLFHSPSPIADGTILVSRRSQDGGDTHGVGRFEPSSGKFELIFDDPDYHDIQAKVIRSRPEPDGRASVVGESKANGRLYCLDVYNSDLGGMNEAYRTAAKRLRVIEGIPPNRDASGLANPVDPKLSGRLGNGTPALAQRRILGEIDIEPDGSFNIELPPNTPIELQTLDARGMALRSCGWIWVRSREPRGCIGCHEDGELTPENVMVKAVKRRSVKLTLPPKRRRTVDFRNNISPIIEQKCAGCHSDPKAALNLKPDDSSRQNPEKTIPSRTYLTLLVAESSSSMGKYVHPGRSRTSPLIWHIFARNTARPWDGAFSEQTVKQMPPKESVALTENEKRTFVEWIDLGAMWNLADD